MPQPLTPPTSEDHARGPEDARITVVQYGDYECPHTRAANRILRDLFAELPEPPRLGFRHFPLRHLHADAQALAEAAEAAAQQGKFWEMHDRMMEHERTIDLDEVLREAAEVGVDVEQLEPLLGSDALRDRVEADVRSGTASGVHSTPTFFFNGALFDGHYDADTIREQLAAATARLDDPAQAR
jgi:protein-disulfide isomerase